MGFARHIIGFITALLFSVLGAVTMPMASTVSHQAEFFPLHAATVVEHNNVHSAARAPPTTVPNVAVTGDVTVMQGSAFVTHGIEKQWTSLNFGADLYATNRVNPAEVGGISGVRPHPDGPAAGGRKPQYQADGGLDQARSDFESAVGGNFTELPNGNLRGTGPNGENIIFNPQSTGGLNPNVTGPPTIYINGSAIRYD